MKENICPVCGSDNVSPAEREYTSDFSIWTVFLAVFLLLSLAFVLFFFLQLHPVIILLLAIAAVSKLLETSSRKKKTRKIEYICLDCKKRFIKNRPENSGKKETSSGISCGQ
jgi:hypothetical protein